MMDDDWQERAIDNLKDRFDELERKVGNLLALLNRRVLVRKDPYYFGGFNSGWSRVGDEVYEGLEGTVTHFHDDLEQVYVKLDDGRTARLFASNLKMLREDSL